MRRLSSKLKLSQCLQLSVGFWALLMVIGCGAHNAAANLPSQKPQTAQQQAYSKQMQNAGDQMNAQRAKDAAAMAAARAQAQKK